jgi:alpha-tubulin suppressor-like RCC1 family protein
LLRSHSVFVSRRIKAEVYRVFALSLTCLQFIMPPRGRTHIALCITLLALPVLSCSHDATGPDSSAVVPKEPRFAGQFVAGGAHTCKLAADQSAYCWGANADGQSGSGVFSFSVPRPVPVSARSQFTTLVGGSNYTCGLAADSTASCWGLNVVGELGDSTTQMRAAPTRVARGLRFASLAAGDATTCGLTPSGSTFCWGTNVGDGTTSVRLSPTPVATTATFTQLAIGYHACALASSGETHCWGQNMFGQLGLGDTIARNAPTPIGGSIHFVMLASGSYHACGLTRPGTAYCWGRNGEGQLGIGEPADIRDYRSTPTLVQGGLSFTSISARGNNTCGIATDHATYCWGTNVFGETGSGSAGGIRAVPTRVTGGLSFERVSVGGGHVCALTSSAVVYCWGSNFAGQLGTPGLGNQSQPVRVDVP